MIKFRTQFEEIRAIEVVRETDKQIVWLNKNGHEQREAKASSWRNWHDTWEDAHAFLVAGAEREVKLLRSQLDRAKGKLRQIREMKKP